ncbi:phosphatidylinositol-glycan biosynthesis class X protein-like [Ornithodoros turicata]|uniref:phosphatidylinositol-glycan biosynthesis class X protein-like n=1 Tax=Ornithodoros turicata TaxID=34597 RepID=UPI00313947AC
MQLSAERVAESFLVAVLLILKVKCTSAEKAKVMNATKLCREQPDIFVERQLAHDGFHRELRTIIYSKSKIKPKSKAAQVLVVEDLPSGAFADPYQLKLLQMSDAEFKVPEKVDVELMQTQAPRHRVLAYLSLGKSELKVHLPVHLRYHKAQHCQKLGSRVAVEFQPPRVYFRLPDIAFPSTCKQLHRLPCNQNMDTLCSWKEIEMESMRPLLAEVPVGCLEDSSLVTVATLLTYCVCSVAIAYSVVVAGGNKKPDPPQQPAKT